MFCKGPRSPFLGMVPAIGYKLCDCRNQLVFVLDSFPDHLKPQEPLFMSQAGFLLVQAEQS